MGKIVKYLFGTNSGRAIVAGLIFLGAMAAARWYYVDRPRELADEARGAGAALLESMSEQLDDALSEAPDAEAFAGSLTERSEWYPRDVPCGATTTFTAEREPIWEVLGAPSEGTTEYQYRFDRRDGVFILRARRDSDCDNLFAVYKLTGRTDWSTIMRTELEGQNVDE